MSDRKTIKVVRTITHTAYSTWPDSYPGMTVEQAALYERQLPADDALEMIYHDDDADTLTLTTEAEVQGYRE